MNYKLQYPLEEKILYMKILKQEERFSNGIHVPILENKYEQVMNQHIVNTISIKIWEYKVHW